MLKNYGEKPELDTLNITQYERRHRRPVSDLRFDSECVFTHLDWLTADQWLETPGHSIRLAWQNDELAGVMGIGNPVNGACWLRMLLLSDKAPKMPVIKTLWQELIPAVRAKNAHMVCTMELETWLRNYLVKMGFKQQDHIITLVRQPDGEFPSVNTTVRVRTALTGDIWAIRRVDSAAFDPPWQLSEDDLRYARRLTSNCSVALLNDEIIAYQLSTSSQQLGHLARLAVIPSMQGQGIGAALVADMIHRFARRNIYLISVNTQATNLRSQRLYTRFGFQHSGHDLSYWEFTI